MSLTRNQLKNYVRVRITDPLNGQVTSAVERAVFETLIDNLFNLADDKAGGGDAFWGALAKSDIDPQTIASYIASLLGNKADLVNGMVPANQLPPFVGVVRRTGGNLVLDAQAEYAYIASGTFTVSLVGAVVGAVVSVTIGASASMPALPAGFVLPPAGGGIIAGKEHRIMFNVMDDGRVLVTVTPLS